MSISSALNNALSGLNVTSRMAEVVSSNLSNVMTDGYGRRGLEISAGQAGNFGGGVRAVGVTRFVDPGLLSDRRQADAALGGHDRTAAALLRVEQALGGPDDPASLNARLAAFESALISASSDPASDTRLATVASRITDLAATLRDNTATVQALRQDADAAILRDVETLNNALQQVADFNKDIRRLTVSGNDPSALIDARQRVVDQIAEIVPVREVPRDNGAISLRTIGGIQLLESKPATFDFVPTPTITAEMTFAGGVLSGITVDGVPIDPANGVGRLDGGSLGAAFALRDITLVEVQDGLDGVAADLIARLEDPANDPTLAPGDIGLLTDNGAPLNLADLSGLAGRIEVNPAVLPASGGDLRLFRDGLNSAVPGPTGNAAQLDRWIAGLSSLRADVPGVPARSAVGRIGDFGSELGYTRLIAEEKQSFAAARWDLLREAELSAGVDTDIELQTLLRVEQAYAANAKVIQSVDFMMQRLMEI